MSVFRIGTQQWATDLLVDADGTVEDAGPMLGWTVGYEWQYIKRYFEQYGFNIESMDH